MRRGIVSVLLYSLVTLAAPAVAAAHHVPPKLQFLHQLERVSVSNLCADPETLGPAVCLIYRDPASSARYRLIYHEFTLVSVWRWERGGWRFVWSVRPDCSVELCT